MNLQGRGAKNHSILYEPTFSLVSNETIPTSANSIEL